MTENNMVFIIDPDEAAIVCKAVPARRAEFLAGRACARTALRALGAPDAPLLSAPNRAPLWPDGVIGSITHCDGFTGAAVALLRDYRGLGFDAEVNEVVTDELLPRVCTQREAQASRHLAGGAHWPTLVFSIKESVYKCLNPIWGIFIATILALACLSVAISASAAEPQRLLLLGQGPDGHPAGTHERRIDLCECPGALSRKTHRNKIIRSNHAVH